MEVLHLTVALDGSWLLALLSLFVLTALVSGRIPLVRWRSADEPSVSPEWRASDVFVTFLAYLLFTIPAALIAEKLETSGVLSLAGRILFVQASTAVVVVCLIFAELRAKGLVSVKEQAAPALGFRASSLSNLAPMVLLFFVTYMPLMWIHSAWVIGLRWIHEGQLSEQVPVKLFRDSVINGDVSSLFLFTLATVVVAPMIEEILFRGVLYPALRDYFCRIASPGKKSLGILAAALLSSLLFAGAHGSFAVILPLLAVGSLLCYVLQKTGSLLYAMAFHALFNGAQLVGMYFMARGEAGS
ncbi:MAG: CPBP family intramembrane glutamic endopeptidase [Planctomycetota bacterium]